jgi:hypothetical protein
MHLATDGTWTGSYTGVEIDGSDMWDAILNKETSPHTEIVHYVSVRTTDACVQKDMVKLNYQEDLVDYGAPAYYFESDEDPDAVNYVCDDVYLLTGTENPLVPETELGRPSELLSGSYERYAFVVLVVGICILVMSFFRAGPSLKMLSKYEPIPVMGSVLAAPTAAGQKPATGGARVTYQSTSDAAAED